MVTSVQNTSAQDAAQKIQDFKDGKINISKADLKKEISDAIANDKTPDESELNIYDSYDKIDTNGDGISYKELQAYNNTKEGLLNSLGISKSSLTNYNNSFALNLLNGGAESTSTSSSLLDYMNNNNSSSDNSSNIDFTGASSTNSAIQNYLSSNGSSSSNSTNSLSLINYMT